MRGFHDDHAVLCRIDELLERVDAGSQVVATEQVDVVEDVATPRRDSSITAWVPFLSRCHYVGLPMCYLYDAAVTVKALLLTEWQPGTVLHNFQPLH